VVPSECGKAMSDAMVLDRSNSKGECGPYVGPSCESLRLSALRVIDSAASWGADLIRRSGRGLQQELPVTCSITPGIEIRKTFA
jgi:hypothetical protein